MVTGNSVSGTARFPSLSCLVLIATITALPGTAPASIILVPGHYPTIQEAIDHAYRGDVVLVNPGDYHENILIHTGVDLVGSGEDVTFIYPAVSDVGPAGGPVFGNSQVIIIADTDTVIEGFTIDGDSPILSPVGVLDARNGIVQDYSSGDVGNAYVNSLVIKNMYMCGVYLRGAGHSAGNWLDRLIINQVNSVPGQSTGIILHDASGRVSENNISSCQLGVSCLSGSGGEIHGNTVTESAIGIHVMGNGSALEVGPGNAVAGYVTAGIRVSEAAAPVDIHDNVIGAAVAAGRSASAGIGIFGQSPGWTGIHELTGNTLLGPARAAGSRGVWIDTYAAGATVDVAARLRANDIRDFDVGILLADSNGDPSGLHDVVIGGDPLAANQFRGNAGFNLELEACDDAIDASWNDWGAYTPGTIELTIWHMVDDPTLGFVTYQPYVFPPTTVSEEGRESATWGMLKQALRLR